MRPHRTLISVLAMAAVLLAAASPARAVTLDKSFGAQPFLDTSLGGTAVAARPELAGLVLEDSVQGFSFNGVFGTVQNRVVRETVSGTLDFYWRIEVDAASQGSIEAFRLGNFGYGAITDADWRIDGLGGASPFVGRVFNPASHPEGAINFLFTDGTVNPDESSRFFFLHTDATAYAKTAQYDLLCAPSGCISGLDATFAPTVAVPEPQTYALMLAGLALMAWTLRRRPPR